MSQLAYAQQQLIDENFVCVFNSRKDATDTYCFLYWTDRYLHKLDRYRTAACTPIGFDTGAHKLSNVAVDLAAIVVSSVNKIDTIRGFGESQLLPVGELAGSLKISGVERDSLNSEPELLLVAVR